MNDSLLAPLQPQRSALGVEVATAADHAASNAGGDFGVLLESLAAPRPQVEVAVDAAALAEEPTLPAVKALQSPSGEGSVVPIPPAAEPILPIGGTALPPSVDADGTASPAVMMSAPTVPNDAASLPREPAPPVDAVPVSRPLVPAAATPAVSGTDEASRPHPGSGSTPLAPPPNSGAPSPTQAPPTASVARAVPPLAVATASPSRTGADPARLAGTSPGREPRIASDRAPLAGEGARPASPAPRDAQGSVPSNPSLAGGAPLMPLNPSPPGGEATGSYDPSRWRDARPASTNPASGADRGTIPPVRVSDSLVASTPSAVESTIEPWLRVLGEGDRTVVPATGTTPAVPAHMGSAGLVLPIGSPASSPASPLASPTPSPLWGTDPSAEAARAPDGWVRPMSEHVLSMVQHGPQVMRLRLDPPELGGLEIRLSLDQDQTNVTFTAQHPSTRDLIEAGLPRLRELLAQGGLALGDCTVSADAGGGERDPSRAFGAPAPGGPAPVAGDEEDVALASASAAPLSLRVGVVDDYV